MTSDTELQEQNRKTLLDAIQECGVKLTQRGTEMAMKLFNDWSSPISKEEIKTIIKMSRM